MNPNRKQTAVPSNMSTAFLAMSFGILIATIAFVAFKCFTQYDTLFIIP
jgi:hypothetical protein